MAKVPFSKSNKQEEDKTLLEPMLYLLKVPGKNVRKKLLSSFNVWTKVDEDKGDLISECIQFGPIFKKCLKSRISTFEF